MEKLPQRQGPLETEEGGEANPEEEFASPPESQKEKLQSFPNDAKLSREEKKLETMKRVLVYLHDKGYPGREKLAKAVGVSVKTIDRHLEELESRGLIEKTGRSSFTVSEFAEGTIEDGGQVHAN